jgi:hypothetical protein
MRPGRCGLGDAARAMRPRRSPRWNGFARQRRQPDPRKTTKIDCKISPKSIEVGRLGYDGASLERHWHPRAPRGRPRSVSRASWGVPGTPQQSPESPRGRPGAPKGAPGSIRERAEATKIEAESHLGWKTSSLGDFSTKWLDFRRCRYACEPSEVPRLPAKTRVRHIALHDELLARWVLKKRRKLTPKSLQSRSKLAVRGQSKRRSGEVERSGLNEARRVEWERRAGTRVPPRIVRSVGLAG